MIIIIIEEKFISLSVTDLINQSINQIRKFMITFFFKLVKTDSKICYNEFY